MIIVVVNAVMIMKLISIQVILINHHATIHHNQHTIHQLIPSVQVVLCGVTHHELMKRLEKRLTCDFNIIECYPSVITIIVEVSKSNKLYLAKI